MGEGGWGGGWGGVGIHCLGSRAGVMFQISVDTLLHLYLNDVYFEVSSVILSRRKFLAGEILNR